MEIWDAYYEDGTLANVDLVRGEPIPDGLFHVACDILVQHTDGDYLLMQRDFRKKNYGGYYEATAGGSALKGEDYMTCAKRELFEETGISQANFKLIATHSSMHTIHYIFLCTTDCEKNSITLQEGETISYKWINKEEFIKYVNSPEIIESFLARYSPYLKEMGYLK